MVELDPSPSCERQASMERQVSGMVEGEAPSGIAEAGVEDSFNLDEFVNQVFDNPAVVQEQVAVVDNVKPQTQEPAGKKIACLSSNETYFFVF